MTKTLLFAGAILLSLALAATAADSITGKWVYEMQMGRGGGGGGGGGNMPARQATLDLKSDGATLTGTLTQPRMAAAAVAAGPAAPTPPKSRTVR